MEKYNWNYCSLGGVTRVKIASGEDIANLGKLDRKMWTVLSCPTKGLEFDQKTLSIIDSNNDGTIHVGEVVAAAEWLTAALKDKDIILKGTDSIFIEQIADEKLQKSAKQILANLGLKKKSISLADASDIAAIFAQTKFNGDGVITAASTDDADLQALVGQIIATEGAVADRSGADGVDADKIELFYADCAAYAAWQAAAAADKAGIFPYADTAAALAACEAIKDKVADYFMRCKLVNFDEDAAGALDVSTDKIAAISGNNLAAAADEIAQYPIARPRKDGILPFDGINPAWQAAFDACKNVIKFSGKKGITEDEWNAVLAKFGAYTAWCGAKAGAAVESLGLDAVKAVVAADKKQALLDLVAKDNALADEANSIAEVEKLLVLTKNFYKFLNNFVSLTELYTPGRASRAMFEVGDLYIDQRCCNLCIKVEDMGKHADMAGLSGMFLIYCNCVSRTKGTSMTIAAVMTDGSITNLRPGKNAIFYDRNGEIWDATVTKVVDNPISIKQAFWSPYRKFANTITERINKSAAEKENKVSSDMTSKANNVNIPTTEEEKKAAQANAPKANFDIAKFAGIFAAIGMAVAYLTQALAALVKPWYMPLVVLGILCICISGPSMFLAWQKLRKRNLGPVLNANGWAINSVVLVNILFGGTLTSVAKYPLLKNASDPFAVKKTPCWKKWLRGIIITIVVLGIAFGILWKTGTFKKWGWFCQGEPVAEAVVEAPAEPAAEPAADADATTPADEPAPAVVE